MREWPETVRPMYRRAIFLDRDGTISEDTHYPFRIEDLKFISGSLAALALSASVPAHIIVVTNQAGIALKKFTVDEMMAFNDALRDQLRRAGARVDAFYYCPHKEPKDLAPGESGCECAKPRPGMLIEAARDFGLDLRESFLIGDKQSDILAGQAAGCRTWLVKTGKGGTDLPDSVASPDSVADNLAEALGQISAELMSVPSTFRLKPDTT